MANESYKVRVDIPRDPLWTNSQMSGASGALSRAQHAGAAQGVGHGLRL